MAVQRAEALFDFEPTAGVELRLKKGDVVSVRRLSVGEGWWEGELGGQRGLFPSSFVKLLPVAEVPSSATSSVSSPEHLPPLTPKSSKKAFMETLLTPSYATQEATYDADKAAELFVDGHTDIGISVGPRWNCHSPQLTVVVRHLQTETRFSGMMHHTVYEVEAKQLGSCVQRRYKHFLWLYDRLAEMFPCVSLPPMPVKQFTGSADPEATEIRRRGLEQFLARISKHPLLGSTKSFRDFLLLKDEKDWKIGRHLSSSKSSQKNPKKLFQAPVYHTVKYPPHNVPLNQLTSIEKFERFSRLLEMNITTLRLSQQQLSQAHGDVMSAVNMLGRDLQRFSRGQQPTTGAQRRKIQSITSHTGTVSNGHTSFYTSPPHASRSAAELEEDGEEEDLGEVCKWNWRDDTRFTMMVHSLNDAATRMRAMAPLYQAHQEATERGVLDKLGEYSGIIPTLPVLVRLHEESMETYNYSKEKDSKKDAEAVRQNCETLNNVLLSEFDYFSHVLVDDFEAMMASFLKQQANFHRKLASEWDSLYVRYTQRTAHNKLSPLASDKATKSTPSSPIIRSKKATSSLISSERSSIPSMRYLEAIDTPERLRADSAPPTPPNSHQYVNIDTLSGRPQDLTSESEGDEEEEEEEEKEEEEEEVQPKNREAGRAGEGGGGGGGADSEYEVQYVNWQVLSDSKLAELSKPPPPKTPPPSSTVPPSGKKPVPLQRRKSPDCSGLKHKPGSACPKPKPEITSPKPNPASSVPKPNPANSGSKPKPLTALPRKPLPPPKPGLPAYSKITDFAARPASAFVSSQHHPTKKLSLDSLIASRQLSESAPKPTSPWMTETKPRSQTSVSSDRKQPLLPPTRFHLPSGRTAQQPQTIPELHESVKSATDQTYGEEEEEEEEEEAVSSSLYHPAGPMLPTTSVTHSVRPEPAPAGSSPSRSRYGSAKEPARGGSLPRDQKLNFSYSVGHIGSGAASHDSVVSSSPSGSTSELMRKLTLRRQQIEKEVKGATPAWPAPDVDLDAGHGDGGAHSPFNLGDEGAAGSKRTSTSSNQSDLVVCYSTRFGDLGLDNIDGGVVRRSGSDKDANNLAKYGIIEDEDGGSFVI